MNKNWYKSKTIWGFGLLTLTLVGQSIGWLPEGVVVEVITYLEGFLGVYGIRDALK